VIDDGDNGDDKQIVDAQLCFNTNGFNKRAVVVFNNNQKGEG